MGYAVTAPLVIVKDDEGHMHHVYQGGRIPSNADEKHVQALLDGDLIEEVSDESSEQAAVEEVEKPDGRASREKWAEYAKTKGASDDELKSVEQGGLSQADLRAKYGN